MNSFLIMVLLNKIKTLLKNKIENLIVNKRKEMENLNSNKMISFIVESVKNNSLAQNLRLITKNIIIMTLVISYNANTVRNLISERKA